MSQVTEDTKKTQQESRRPYQAPQLLVYGAVKDFTAGGTGSVAEVFPGAPWALKTRYS
jgi:hypothetical protein